jgi:hypothetical protein
MSTQKKRRHSLVENQETLQDLLLVLIRHGAPNLVVEFLVCEGLRGLQTLIRERRSARVVISEMTSGMRIRTYDRCEDSSGAG